MSTFRSIKNFNECLLDEVQLAEKHCKALRKQLKIVSVALENCCPYCKKHRPDGFGDQCFEERNSLDDAKWRKHNKEVLQKNTLEESEISNLLRNKNKFSVKNPAINADSSIIQCRRENTIFQIANKNKLDEISNLSFENQSMAPTIAYANKIQRPLESQQTEKHCILPFVAATSTTRSHNICLSLQHMLAKFKRHGSVRGARTASDEQNSDKIEEIQTGVSCEGKNREPKDVSTADASKNFKFKEVLRNVYEEFTSMTQQYENIITAYDGKGANKMMLRKKLESLDKTLRKKEDEIIIFIHLYREVMIMKERIRFLEDATNNAQTSDDKEQRRVTFSESTNLRMKFLLRQINKLHQNLSRS